MSVPGYSAPIRLKGERAWRTYHGGKLLDELHGVTPATDGHFPEDWICSTVRAINAGREDVVEGMNRLADADMTLKDFISADPVAALGADHVARWGESLAVLVKLIDAAERLGVQCHPDREKARAFFGSPFGKTECWHVVGGREIGGCLLMEIQEPTDYTFRTERVTPQGFAISEKACHYGIGFDSMFECFRYDGCDGDEARRRYMVGPQRLESSGDFVRTAIIGSPRTDCFSLERLDIRRECRFGAEGEFSGLYVLSGCGRIECTSGVFDVSPGDQFFVPAKSEGFSVSADGELVVFRSKSGITQNRRNTP